MTSARRPARASRKPDSPKRDPLAEAVRYLARGDRSAGQVERYLASRRHPAGAIRRTLLTLRRLGYINDEAVALRVAQARLARRPMGREALSTELKAREFSVETVAHAVRGAYGGKSDQEIAEGILRSLPRRYTDPERENRRRAGLLKGRGFSDEVIEAVIGSDADCQVSCR